MELFLNRNIQKFRKERHLTQEQLAEAMGVTVGAVSKWENGLSNPDIALLAALAEFFEVSVDVLLGYGWEHKGMGQYAERIKQLTKERKFEEGIAQARAALQKYPNSFSVLYESADLFQKVGMAAKDNGKEAYETALELFMRSLEFVEQSEEVKPEKIHRAIGELYELLGKTEAALAYFKEHNPCEVNDVLIGRLYTELKQYDEAKQYLLRSLGGALLQMCLSSFSLGTALLGEERYEEALALFLWQRNMIAEATGEKEGYLLKQQVLFDTMVAIGYAYYRRKDDGAQTEKACREWLALAIKEARRFDANPDYTLRLKVLQVSVLDTLFDNMGKAVDFIEILITKGIEEKDKEEKAFLQKLFQEEKGRFV